MRTLALIVLSGCVHEAATVDEGCVDTLGGEGILAGEPPALLDRANCWRGYLGLPPLAVTAPVQRSVTRHRDVLAARGVVGSRGDMNAEGEDEDGFQGATPFAREVAAGALSVDTVAAQASVWGWFVYDVAEPLDAQLGHPMLRDALLQPGITGAGYAEATIDGARRAYLEVLAPLPSGRRVGRPVVFPKDGATDVPTGWSDPWAGTNDPWVDRTRLGYPVTITLSGPTATTNPWNPFEIVVASATLTTERGEVLPAEVLPPAAGGRLPLHTTVAIVPAAALPADTTIHVDAELSASGMSWVVATSFRTGAAPADSDVPETDLPPDTDAP